MEYEHLIEYFGRKMENFRERCEVIEGCGNIVSLFTLPFEISGSLVLDILFSRKKIRRLEFQ